MKKVISLFLAIIMILSIGTVGVSAYEFTEYVFIYTSLLGAEVGDYLYFPVYYEDDTYYTCRYDENAEVRITLPCYYDPEILKPVDVTPSELLYGMNFEGEISRVDVYTYIDEYGVEITYPYFYADVTFDADEKIENGEILFNIKMEIIGEPVRNDSGAMFNSFQIVEDLDNQIITECKWEVVDGDGKVVQDISSKIMQNGRMDGILDEGYILEGYEPFIPPVEEDKPTDGIKNTLTADTVIKSGENYYISTVDDLKTLAKIVNEDGNTCEGASFWLNNDIVVNDGVFTLSDSGEPLYNGKPVAECKELVSIESIGTSSRISFKGTFVGDGHTISGLYQNALFGYCSRAHISDIHIKNAYVTSNSIFCNTLSSCGTIMYSSVEGIVNCESNNVGIFAGRVIGTDFLDCYATGYVKGDSNVGGFVGYMSGSEVDNSMSNAKVYANSTAGGFAGRILGDDNTFINCAAIGTLECADGTGGQFTSSIALYYFDDGYDIERTLNVCYAAVKTAEGVGFCHSFEGDTAGVNQCYYMSNEDDENGFITYTEAEIKTTEFVDILHADIFEQIGDSSVEWGYYGIYFVGNDGEFPIPYGVHCEGFDSKGHDFSDWDLYSEATEKRVCSYHGCGETERRKHYHSWGEYHYNNDASVDIDGTKTATCTKENCAATDTVPDWENIRTNAIPVSENITLEKGKLYTISSFDDWNVFTELCKQDTTDVSFALVNDIKINHRDGYKMKPIETFNGTFDGLGHSITSVILGTNDTDLTGIFALCDGAEIKNITINGTIVSDGGAYGEALAVLCAKAVNSKIENCTIICSASGTAKYIGGLVGYAENCEIIGCRTLLLGAVGAEKSTVGGLVGKVLNCTVSECYNNADIPHGNTVGGLFGELNKSEVSYCYNIGNVNSEAYSGGFAGRIYPTKEDRTIKYCYTVGEVTGTNVGEFCGTYGYSNIFALDDCYYVGSSSGFANADSDGLILAQWEAYCDSLRDEEPGIVYPPLTPDKSLGLYNYPEDMLKGIVIDHGDYYVGGIGEVNDGYSQLRRFHTEHIWGEYSKDSKGNTVAECLCEFCHYTDVIETPPVEEKPLFEFGVTAQHIRNKFDMLYYPVSFGFSMYDDADIRYSDICADVADLAFGCDTEVVMKYIYDATTLDFVYVYDDSWNGSVEVLEHGSTGMTGDEGQEYNYIILKAKFSAVGYVDGKAPFFLKFAVVEDNFINSDGTVRKVIDNVPYSEDQLCVWNAWDHEGDSFDFSNRIEFKSSDYETSGQTYDDLLLEDDIIATDVDMPTVTFTPEHARKGDLAYYPCTYDSNVDYDEWVRSATGFKDSTTKIQIKVDYDSSTLELLDALPSKELYDLGGTVTIIETGDLYPDNPDYGHMKYAVVQLDFDALDFTDGCLFSLKFRVLQENFLDEKGRPIDLVNSFVADWVVTSNDGKSHDLRYYVSSSYLGLATFGNYEELILADYEPFDPTLIEIEDRFEIVGGATVMTQGGVNYIVGLQPSLTKTKFQSTYIDSENVTVEINMSTARYLGTGSTVTVKSEITGEVVAEYVVVIYGDVDGSATINGRDAAAVSNSITGVADSLTGAAKLAANVEGTRTTINAKDAAVISSVTGGTMIIDQSTGKGITA